jgi:hypothetical protein
VKVLVEEPIGRLIELWENAPARLLDKVITVGTVMLLELIVKESLATLIDPDSVAGGVTE